MSTLGPQTGAAGRNISDLVHPGPRVGGGMIGTIPALAPVRFGAEPVTTEVNSLAPSGSMILARTVSRRTPIGPSEGIDVLLGSAGRIIDPVRWLVEWGTQQQAERAAAWGLHPRARTIPETITPAAEKHARSLGLYGSLVLAKEIARETLPSMRALNVDVKEDPDEGGYPTICFAITTREPVDRVVELDDALQDALYNYIPAHHRPYLSFAYRFE